MATNPISKRFRPLAACELHRARGQDNIIKHGYLKVKFGARRRYRCNACARSLVLTPTLAPVDAR